MGVTARRLKNTDWDKVEKHICGLYEDRKSSTFRKNHEAKWKEVDRQIAMNPLEKRIPASERAQMSWQNALELGDLSEASEIITADVARIMFPGDRTWFTPHTQIQWPLGQNGRPAIDGKKQEVQDGILRNLMVQQHKDFGFKGRFKLSVKEALHHGSFAAEVRFEKQMMVRNGSEIKSVGAPVWVPYSMWNTYPDPSPSVIGTNLFYTGDMILVEYISLAKLKMKSGEGWMKERLKLVEKKDKSDKGLDEVELIKFKGDIVIERGDGDVYLPNSDVIIANGKLVYYDTAPLPYPNVVFTGYERQDVRDPYYTSPIIKQSPTQRMTTIVANEFLNATQLKVRPPIEYDANDPDYVANDGPLIAPGAKTPTRSMGKGFTALDIGDPRFALDAYTMGRQQMKEGLGVSSNRAGVREADRETATAANLANQGAEVRTMEFIGTLEPQALLPFLYMQHEFNRKELTEYTFYNDEMNTPDFMVADKSKLQEDVHFEVVGSRGVLGEEKRDRKIAETTAFFAGNPLFAQKLEVEKIMLEMYKDAGKKNSEQWVKVGDQKPQIPPQIQEEVQKMQEQMQQAAEQIKKLEQENLLLKSREGTEKQKMSVDMQQFQNEQARAKYEFDKNYEVKLAELELKAKDNSDSAKMALDMEKFLREQAEERRQFDSEYALKIAELNQQVKATQEKQEKSETEKTKPKRRAKVKIQRTPDGFVVDDDEGSISIKKTGEGYELN